ncbi:MAG: YtxH domain-containing protein [Acidobacteriota bacterium]|nr:YtxH domain-containing protein [Acidobacteriota bacterium]
MAGRELETMLVERSAGRHLAAVAVGALAGAALGLLYAPGPGSELRDRLRRTARSGMDRTAALVDHGQRRLARERDRVRGVKARTGAAVKAALGRQAA